MVNLLDLPDELLAIIGVLADDGVPDFQRLCRRFRTLATTPCWAFAVREYGPRPVQIEVDISRSMLAAMTSEDMQRLDANLNQFIKQLGTRRAAVTILRHNTLKILDGGVVQLQPKARGGGKAPAPPWEK